MGEDSDDPGNWDAKSLSAWMMSRFQVNLSQAQIRRTSADELESRLRQAAVDQIDQRDCSGLQKYLEPLFTETQLAAWAKDKFAVEIKPREFMADENAQTRKEASDIAILIEERARAAYARREIEYPVEHAMTFAFGDGSSTDNPYAAEFIRSWAMSKFRADLSLEHIRHISVKKVGEELVALQESWMTGDTLAREVDGLIASYGNDRAELVKKINERFSLKLAVKDLEPDAIAEVEAEEENERHGGEAQLTLRDFLIKQARQFFRRELTQLEQFVLIMIFDDRWKDHLYGMDMLKAGIGLVSFAEQDPRVVYKKEGYAYFEQMMAAVREQVTDLIFRAKVAGQQQRSAYRETAAVHEESGGYGVAENLAVTAGATTGQVPVGSEAGEGGEAPAKVKTIVRDAPKVGRNDPCPCGSGKKYKKCCGVNAA
jgi:preprotein translocase subunit SecA